VEHKWPIAAETEPIPEEEQTRGGPIRRLVGVVWTGDAEGPESAARKAWAIVREVLDYLRTNWYVRSHVLGAVRVDRLGEHSVVWISPSQPFWTKKAGQWRRVPVLPTTKQSADLPEPQRSRVEGVRWHLSQAIADWQEDPHSAASKIWQALETLAEPGPNDFGRVRNSVAKEAVKFLIDDLSYWMAKLVSGQCDQLSRMYNKDGRGNSDWYFWDEKNVELNKWFGRVFHPDSTRRYATYNQPPAWPFLYDGSVGILHTLHRLRELPSREAWLDKRLERDLALLYGMRNSLAHSGIRLFPDQTAEYLGQVGLELVIAQVCNWCLDS
jgi:hypothetical protein